MRLSEKRVRALKKGLFRLFGSLMLERQAVVLLCVFALTLVGLMRLPGFASSNCCYARGGQIILSDHSRNTRLT
jgi:hypothetical protein